MFKITIVPRTKYIKVNKSNTSYSRSCPRLQSMAVFDEISGAEKAQILGAGALHSCQVRIIIVVIN